MFQISPSEGRKLHILGLCVVFVALIDTIIGRSILADDVLATPVPEASALPEPAGTPMLAEEPVATEPVAIEPAPAAPEIPPTPEPAQPTPPAPPPEPKKKTGAPVHISMNSIALDAAIERVALAPDGSMDVPRFPSNAGWYSLGPKPGEAGTAVIDGHVDWKNGATGVFADLRNVVHGDRIVVRNDRGENAIFEVRETRMYDPGADALGVFSSTDGKSHLNLITCDGIWDKEAKQYSKRLVVFADKIE